MSEDAPERPGAAGRQDGRHRKGDRVTRPELRRQQPKELPRREGTFDTIVEQAEADPAPEEVAATLADKDDEQRGGRAA